MNRPINTSRKLRVREVAELLRVSKSWLDKKRLSGGGPPFLKFGRRVVYDVDDLEDWAVSNRRRHTSEQAL
jgi:predicted DNA-binding transcriptional regulator AlpA